MNKTIDQMTIVEIENHLIERRFKARPTIGDLKKAIADLPDNWRIGVTLCKGDVEDPEREEQSECVTHISVSEYGFDLVCDDSALDADIDGYDPQASEAMYRAWKGAANG